MKSLLVKEVSRVIAKVEEGDSPTADRFEWLAYAERVGLIAKRLPGGLFEEQERSVAGPRDTGCASAETQRVAGRRTLPPRSAKGVDLIKSDQCCTCVCMT